MPAAASVKTSPGFMLVIASAEPIVVAVPLITREKLAAPGGLIKIQYPLLPLARSVGPMFIAAMATSLPRTKLTA